MVKTDTLRAKVWLWNEKQNDSFPKSEQLTNDAATDAGGRGAWRAALSSMLSYSTLKGIDSSPVQMRHTCLDTNKERNQPEGDERVCMSERGITDRQQASAVYAGSLRPSGAHNFHSSFCELVKLK